MRPPTPAPPARGGYPPATADLRGLGLALPDLGLALPGLGLALPDLGIALRGLELALCSLGLALLTAASGCADPSDPSPEGPAVTTAFSRADTVTVSRDDYRPSGRVCDDRALLDPDGALALLRGEQRWTLEQRLLWHTAGRANYAFSWAPDRPALPLRPGENLLLLTVEDPRLPGEGVEIARTRITLDPRVLIVPVVVWNLGVSPRRLNRRAASLALDRAPTSQAPAATDPESWLHQRVDEIWVRCGVQLRLQDYLEPWPDPTRGSSVPTDSPVWPEASCWQHPVVSNQNPWNESCFTERPACAAAGPQTQDFWDCDAQEENRCTLAELVRHAQENPAYDGPPVYRPGALNVYFAPQLDLREDLTLGVGCAGERPLVVLNDLWSDASRLRLAHEIGHALGINRHIPGTVMGDPGQRTAEVSEAICETVRAGAGATAESPYGGERDPGTTPP